MQLEVCGILGKTEKLAQPLFPLLPAFPQNLFWLFQQFQLQDYYMAMMKIEADASLNIGEFTQV